MRYIFIHPRLPAEMQRLLSAYGKCIPLPPFEKLPHPVSSHPDMLMANIEGTLFVHQEYEQGQRLLASLGVPFSVSHSPVEKKYPKDVRLNCFSLQGCLFANKKAVSGDLLRFAEEKAIKWIPVKQGYAKCATAIAGDAVATADPSIAKATAKEGIPTLFLKPQPIGIEVYDTGFIGGACVAMEKELLFFGKIEDALQYEELRDFFKQQGVSLISLSGEPLFDYGGAVVFHHER